MFFTNMGTSGYRQKLDSSYHKPFVKFVILNTQYKCKK